MSDEICDQVAFVYLTSNCYMCKLHLLHMKMTLRLTYKIAEAAQLLGVSTITVRRAIARGLIKPIRAFRTPLISAAELERFVNQSPTQNRF